MRISEHFASAYIKAEDLQGRRAHVVIASVGVEDIGDEHKLVAYFRGRQKGFIVNRTNAGILANELGDETDGWAGHEIILYTAKVNFQGRMVDGIRVDVPSREPLRPANPTPQSGGSPVPDDDIPF
ncbi:hypothetical protein RB623_24255 [Mesorhizobium sp. LHD-90]|uniref:hypothetical protein n=1 Tax=Mesorhizobium sp. LHD-90 TaxID=3071414 RepID=UPI0027DFD507|nr:hypothetical protein [Mesorhizobium sp. LHD-90]MDQ6437178.1 hypothetical protein [Mesorhizobium sp. LHD-90]